MDARIARAALLAAALASLGASYRTPNFVVQAPTQEIAQQVGAEAERFRKELAIEWLGKAMPNWSQPCPITVQVAPNLGAGGATSFVFNNGEVFGWQMNIQGSLERVLDSVLPHEITHTIFASHFRQPLPRWADEGGCTTVEHTSERNKQQRMLISFLKTGRGIPFSQMFAMKDYPRDILPLYAQGHSLASYLLGQGGKQKFMDYLAEGMQTNQWVEVTRKHYGYADLAVLQNSWLEWVRRGSPMLPAKADDKTLIAKADTKQRGNLVVRGQSPETSTAPAPSPAPVAPAAKALAGAPPRPAPETITEAQNLGWYAAGTRPAAVATPANPASPTPPQPVQPRGKQVILEWNQAEAAANAGQAPPTPTRSVYETAIGGNATVLR